tara:strand:+ start:787 stop:1179 length:393 start_codon:yes stop_codon:yes gene_type:complete
MPLKIVLRPGEKVAINQAVILNGGEKSELVLENKASILRERDIMSEEEADTPAKRIYFMVQMLYMFPEKDRYYQQKFNQLVKQFIKAVPSSTAIVFEIGKDVITGDVYGALKKCRKLMKYEQEVLKHVTA